MSDINLAQSIALGLVKSVLSISGRSSKLLILIYHRVLPTPDPFWDGDLDANTFDWHMRVLHRYFNVLRLSEALELLRENKLPANSVCVTFDDGYADNHDVALPILLKYSVPATFFIAVGFLNGGRMWNDTVIESVRSAPGDVLDLSNIGVGQYDISSITNRRESLYQILERLKYLTLSERLNKANQLAKIVNVALPNDLMMTTEQLISMRDSGMEIGAHTINHPILTQVPDEEAEREIVKGREQLEELLTMPITLFAFPNGRPGKDYDERHVEMVKRVGFDYSVSTAWGAVSAKPDPFQLPRIAPWDQTAFRFALRLHQARFSKSAG